MSIELDERVRISARIELLSGLHIGAGQDEVKIGGTDNAVVRDPVTHDPYIPGSSIKGKLRFLMEWAFNNVEPDGQVWGSGDESKYSDGDPVLRIFGTTLHEWTKRNGPTRLTVRDAHLEQASRDQMLEQNVPLSEEKTEVLIDRVRGAASQKVGPRQTERVPRGARFDSEMVFRIYALEGDAGERDRAALNWFLHGLKLLEQDSLGGSGSRGYGRVRLRDLAVHRASGEVQEVQQAFDKLAGFDPDRPPALV